MGAGKLGMALLGYGGFAEYGISISRAFDIHTEGKPPSVLKMEELLDKMNFPQSFTEPRSFSQPQESLTHAPPKGEVQSGKCGTFAVRVYFRQNASWQGSVSWLEGDREERFRSVLELAFLLNSALSGEEPPKKAKRTSA